MHEVEPGPADDEPVRMTTDERTVWAYLATVVVTSGWYLTLMVERLAAGPVEEISWVGPMLWTIGASVLGTIVVSIVLAISGTLSGVVSDVRDQEISRIGSRASIGVMGTGFAGALALAMLDADPFWIGNLLFVFGTIGAVVETTTKIRLYRRGF